MNPTAGGNDQSKRRRAVILAAVIIGALTIIGLIVALTLSRSQGNGSAASSADTEQGENAVATVEGFKQNISSLKSALDRAKASNDTAKSTLKDASSKTAGASSVAKLKEVTTKELDRRISQLESSVTSLRASRLPAETPAVATTDDPRITSEFKQAIQDRTQAFVAKLKAIKTKVAATTTLADAQALAKAVDSQAILAQIMHVQASSTEAAIDFQTLLSLLHTADRDLQAQIVKIKECARGAGDNADADASTSGCEEFTLSSEEMATQMERKLEVVRLSIDQINTTIASAAMLLTSLSTQAETMMNQLGDIEKLGDITKQTKVGNISGLLTSFTAIGLQLDIAHRQSEAALIELASIFDQMTT